MAGIVFTEGSGVADSIFGRCQAPVRLFLEKRAEGWEQESMLPRLFDIGSTTHGVDMFTSTTGMDDFVPVDENGAYPETTFGEGFSKMIRQMTWKSKFVVSQEAVEDAILMDFKKKPQKFITSYYRTREKFGAALYGAALSGNATMTFANKAFSTQTADEEVLFSKTHRAAGRGKAQANICSDAFSADALAAAETAMQNFKDDDGEILALAPDTILIPNEGTLKRDVFAAIGADKDPSTANNGYNFEFGRWNVIVWPYLNQYLAAGAKPWVLIDSSYLKDMSAAAWLDRVPLEVKSVIDPNTDANAWNGRARYSAGFVDWRFAFAGGISRGDALISA